MESTSANMAQAQLAAQVLGFEETSIDDKGRVRLPRKMQVALGDGFVLSLLPIGCLAAYSAQSWLLKTNEILARPSNDPDRELFTRDLGPNAESGVNTDAQGRFVIPYRLRKLSGLEKDDVLLIGCIDRLEIWTKKDRTAYAEDPEGFAKDKRRAVMESASRRLRA